MNKDKERIVELERAIREHKEGVTHICDCVCSGPDEASIHLWKTTIDSFKNTDTEIWRKFPEGYGSPSISVTKEGNISIGVDGHVYTKSIEEWHNLSIKNEFLEFQLTEN